ncbi:MAG: cell division protein SepF [Propionibacteriaceae bacterium]|nr:cell division protein SepF [Propionibacteriaceae bacterium]
MADRLSKVAEFMLGPRASIDDDDFETEFHDTDQELTDIVDMETKKSKKSTSRSRAKTPRKTSSSWAEGVAQASVTPIDQRPSYYSNPMSQIHHERPASFSEAAGIGELYKQGVTIILNLGSIDQKQAQRLVDFTSGMAFVTSGRLEEITSRVYMLIPAAIEFSESDKEQLRELHKASE